MKKRTKIIIQILLIIIAVLWVFSLDFSDEMGEPIYGVSFSRFHTDELGLDWRETYLALQNELGVKNFRFSAHWPLTEPEKDKYNFAELDFQMSEARSSGVSVILAVGRRLPGWPECHEPQWVQDQKLKIKNQKEFELFKQERILKYIETVVNRYKGYDNIIYWQVENEPFLTGFSRSECGPLDKEFLDEEIALVKSLDDRPILITDSGEIGDWFRAYSRGDVFGTSLYLYVWPRSIGFPIRYPVTPAFFRIKHNLVRLILGAKPSFVVELSAEPWLLQPIVETPTEVQLDRMGIDKFNEMIDFSAKSGFNESYLWGAEWWYWLKLQGLPDHWERAKQLFN
ncbi:MAG: beta-galactosidase [Candidatus Yanofskybacteria bacterium]|nr:beta-galactosidase [Candidatus Yanofskybacteria bacterium]